jgi:hypothetical protein
MDRRAPVEAMASTGMPQPLDEHGKPRAGPLNRRAEMWMKSEEGLEEPGGVQVPDSDSLQADACSPSYTWLLACFGAASLTAPST